jgi:hypothetical protein
MATITHGSFAESTQGNYKIKKTGSVSAATLGVTRSDSYVSPTETVNLSGRAITGSVIVSGGGDKGTAAVAATNTLTFDDTAYTAGTATWTFSAGPDTAGALDTTTITLVDFDGTSVVFEIDDAGTGAGNGVTGSNIPITNRDSGGSVVAGSMGPSNLATSFVYWINQQSALDIVATNPAAGQITLTQGKGGAASNTAITLSAASTWNTSSSVNCPSDFTGGAVTAPSDAAITIIATDGTTKTFTPVASGANAYLNQFNLGGEGATAATNLETLVDSTTKGLGGKVSVARSTGQLTFTQDVAGAAGNTVVTVAGNLEAYMSISPSTNFTGGADRIPVKMVVQMSIDGVNWSDEASSVTIIDDVDLSTTGTQVGTVPAASMVASPYYRIGFNVDGNAHVAGSGMTLIVEQSYAYDANIS